MSTLKDLSQMLLNKYDFKYNTVTSRLYFKPKEHTLFELVDDFIINSLFVESKKELKGLNKVDFISTLKSDLSASYNPFEDYFNKLPKWDGRDYIKELTETVKTSKKLYWRRYFKKWIVGVVDCVLNQHQTNHQTLIFVGKQGVGKTTWLNNLLPKQLNEHLYMGIITNNKDTLIHLSECMFINIDEFETIGSKGLKHLKSVITQSHIRLRRPYGSISESLPRRASFMASVNNTQFLVDTTGNRRFFVFEVKSIDFNHNVNMDMVYSQCLHLLNQEGFQYHLSQKDNEKISKVNESYRLMMYEEELLIKYFRPCKKGEGELLTATEVLQRVNERSRTFLNNTSVIKMGRAINRHDFISGRNKNKAKAYWVKERRIKRNKDLSLSKLV